MNVPPRSDWPALPGVTHDTIHAGGIDMHLASAGPADGPPVLLLHGFPELWFSWRHQIVALAEAGYRVLAPDVRGTGGTAAPGPVEQYDILHRTRDAIGILDALHLERAVIVGHDWGAAPAWHAALIHPRRVHAVAGLSVPYLPRMPLPGGVIAMMREHIGEDFYVVFFQEPDAPEAMLMQDVRRTFTTTKQWSRSWGEQVGDQPPRPAFLTEEELAVYVDTYRATGFTGGLNWYRNMDRDQEVLAPWDGHRITVPALFVQGTRDPTAGFAPTDGMEAVTDDLRIELIEGGGHWIQQERPAEVNALLLGFLQETGW